MTQLTKVRVKVRVIEEYQAEYPDPIQAKAGDDVVLDWENKTDIAGWVWSTNQAGKSGWVPIAYLDIHGEKGKLLHDYSARELTVHVGEVLTVHKTESSFHFVTDENGQQGWVPTKNVKQIGE
jgi:hypothetical protein